MKLIKLLFGVLKTYAIINTLALAFIGCSNIAETMVEHPDLNWIEVDSIVWEETIDKFKRFDRNA